MKMTNNYEINLRTKAWGISFSGKDLVLTAIHNRFNQFEYKETDVLANYENLEDQEIIDFIDEFQTRTKVKRGDAFLGIPRSEVHAFVVEFPKEAEETLPDTIGYQIEGLYPGDPTDIDVFHQIIGRDEQLKVQIFCIPKTYIGRVFGLIRRWDLKLVGITIEHLAVVNALTRIFRAEIKKKQLAVLHITSLGIEVLGLRGGILSGTFFKKLDESPGEAELGVALEEAFSQIRLDPYSVDAFILSGFPSESLILKLNSLGLQFTDLKDTKGNVVPGKALSGVGLAMTAIHEKLPFTLNTLPNKLQKRHHQLPVLVGILFMVLVAGWFVSGEVRDFMGLKKELARYKTRNEKLEDQLLELTLARNGYEDRLELVESYKKYIYGSNLMLKVLSVLSHEIPNHSFLTSFSLRDGVQLTMQIETDDFFEVRNKLEKLPYFKNVDTANAISQARTGNKKKTNLKMDIVLEAFDE